MTERIRAPHIVRLQCWCMLYSCLSAAEAIAAGGGNRPPLNARGQRAVNYLRQRKARESERAAAHA